MNTLRTAAVLAVAWAVLATLVFDTNAQTWNIQVVDNRTSLGYETQVAVTSDGTPYITDVNQGNYDLYLRWWVPSGGGFGSWETLTIGDAYYSDIMEMVADSADRLHIAWNDLVKDSVMYAVFDGPTKSWHRSPRGITGATYAEVDLAIFDDEGLITPSIAFVRNANGQLYVATQDPVAETWSFETLYDLGDVEYVSVAADSLGALHIAFYESVGDDLLYATNAYGPWTIEYVDIAGVVGNYCSIVVEPGNIPYIVYYDQTHTDLKYARLIPE